MCERRKGLAHHHMLHRSCKLLFNINGILINNIKVLNIFLVASGTSYRWCMKTFIIISLRKFALIHQTTQAWKNLLCPASNVVCVADMRFGINVKYLTSCWMEGGTLSYMNQLIYNSFNKEEKWLKHMSSTQAVVMHVNVNW